MPAPNFTCANCRGIWTSQEGYRLHDCDLSGPAARFSAEHGLDGSSFAFNTGAGGGAGDRRAHASAHTGAGSARTCRACDGPISRPHRAPCPNSARAPGATEAPPSGLAPARPEAIADSGLAPALAPKRRPGGYPVELAEWEDAWLSSEMSMASFTINHTHNPLQKAELRTYVAQLAAEFSRRYPES